MRDPFREMAERIMKAKPGQCICISRQEINLLPALPPWAATADITMGFDRVKEYIVGSAWPHLWRFDINQFTGDITVCRVQSTPGAHG